MIQIYNCLFFRITHKIQSAR